MTALTRRLLLALPIAAMLSACQTAADNAPAASAAPAAAIPANYRQMVVQHVRETFNDPYSIRDASISQPITGTAIYGTVHTVCVKANAKNRMGAYVGMRERAIVFREGRITGSSEEYTGMSCADAVYQPFPEIMAVAGR